MYTQCPKCRTVFHVTREILDVKAGLVRCGDCENVFNATWNLVDEAPESEQQKPLDEELPSAEASIPGDTDPDHRSPPATDPLPPARAPEPSPTDNDRAAGEDPFDSESAEEDISDEEIRRTLRLDEDFYHDMDQDDEDAEDTGGVQPTEATIGVESFHDETESYEHPGSGTGSRVEPRLDPTPRAELSVNADDALLPRRAPPGSRPTTKRSPLRGRPAIQLKAPTRPGTARVTATRREPNINWVSIPDRDDRGSGWLWASGVLILIVLVVLQVRFLLVDELYSIPAARPYIGMFCGFAGCSPPARSDPASIRIAQTRVDLHPEVPGAMRIRVNLINQADFAQPYPAIQLTLSDKDGRIVGRRTYGPSEYLGDDQTGTLLDPGVLAVASINLAQPSEVAVGFEATVVATPMG